MDKTNNFQTSHTAFSNYNNADVSVKVPKVAIYCRLSQEDRNKAKKEDDSESIKNQKAMLQDIAEERGWEIYEIFSDDDYTGTDRNRPSFNKMISLAKEKKFDIILCKSQSRFARELEIVEKYINGLFFEWGIRFVSITDNTDTAREGTVVMRQMNGIMDERYIENMSVSIKSALKVKRKNGEHTGGLALYGYMKDPKNKGHLIIDPEAAEVVRDIYLMYDRGLGKTAIARELNSRGIPNPTQYKVNKGIAYKIPKNKLGTLWKYSAIDDVLHNQMYIGDMVQGKYGSVNYKSKKNKPKPKSQWVIVKGTHEPIIEKELWDRVQSKINSNIKTTSITKIGTFARKCKCEGCGYTLKTSKSHDDRYLRCPTRQVDKSSCTGSFISEKVLERTVLKELNTLINKYLNVDKLEENIILNNIRSEKEKILKEIAQYQSNISRQAKGIQNLYLDKVNGIITQEQFISYNEDFKKAKAEAESLLEEKNKMLLQFKDEQDILKSKRALLEKYINVDKLSREMVEELIDHITVGARDPITKKKTVEIYWKI